MKENHITFQTMSDFIDGDIIPQDKKDEFFTHINTCAECAKEFEKLNKMMNLFSEAGKRDFSLETFSYDTMRKIKKRALRRKAKSFMPAAAAASVMVLIGYGLFNPFKTADIQLPVAENKIENKAEIGTGIIPVVTNISNLGNISNVNVINETEDVLDIIRKNNAKILKISDNFIEGEVTEKSYSKLKRNLGFRKVVFSSPSAVVPKSSSNQWRNSNISPVGFGNYIQGAAEDPLDGVKSTEKSVRFRIYK